MYENFDEMKVLAEQARQRLQEQVKPEEEEVDIYAELRDEMEEGSHSVDNNYDYEIDYGLGDEEYGPIPTLNSEYNEEPVPTLDPYDEPLFPGGPGKSQIQSWKKEWEGYDLYVTEVLNETFVFRTLNRYEYKQLVSLQKIDALQREEVICQTVTLWPENYTWKEMATSKAGVPSTYSDIIMEKSGFTKDYAIQVI